jgi:hypothetical protein
MFTTLWACLALYQYARTARACADGSVASTLLWVGQFLLLAAPLAVLKRRARTPTGGADAGDLSLVLLAYVPVTVALRIAEGCARHW